MVASSSIEHEVPLRILLADSNIAAQAVGIKILAAAGHEVIGVSDGLTAVKRIAQFRPDLLVLDIHLAGYSGVEICHKVKAVSETAHISVLLSASRMEPFRAEQSIEAQADGLILKPFEAGCLIPLVVRIAERMRPPESPLLSQLRRPELHSLWQSAVKRSPAVHQQCWPHSPRVQQEICDVCGCVNRTGASVCRQCDVPLPSSVTSHQQPS